MNNTGRKKLPLINRYNIEHPGKSLTQSVAKQAHELHKTIPQNVKYHHQYDQFKAWEFYAKGYLTIAGILKHGLFDCTLDFGCGTGIGEYACRHRDVDLVSADLDSSWASVWSGSTPEYFDLMCKNFGVHKLKVSPACRPDISPFSFYDQPKSKFDAVITFRYPDLNHQRITFADFRQELEPYCVDNFSILYCHVGWNAALDFNYDPNIISMLSYLVDQYSENIVYNSNDITVFEL